MLIGFGHKAGVGKDTSGDYLVRELGFRKDSFARSLKELCMELFSFNAHDVFTELGKSARLSEPIVYTPAVRARIFDRVFADLKKCGIDTEDIKVHYGSYSFGKLLYTPREVLQFIGTDVIRRAYPAYHLKTLLFRVRVGEDIAICDVRFPNEALAIKQAGGVLIDIRRPALVLQKHTSSHLSEAALDEFDWDYVVENVGSLSYLYAQLSGIMSLQYTASYKSW